MSSAADATTIEIGQRIVTKNCRRLGINLGNDKYYSGAALVKKRTSQNFEGTSYRQCHFGPVQDAGGATTWFAPNDSWEKLLVGGRYTILSGPAKGSSGNITGIRTKVARHKGNNRDFPYFVFDKQVKPGPPNTGILVERLMLDQGSFRKLDGYWTSKKNRIEIGDVPPGSFGSAAVVLDARTSKAHLRFGTHYQRYGQTNGTWNVHFWSKALSGQPQLRVAPLNNWGPPADVSLQSQWNHNQLVMKVGSVPEPQSPDDDPHLLFTFEVTGGEVLLDDVEIWMEGDRNPTVFRDDCVNALKIYQPGILRYLQMGGNTLDNCLKPPLRAHSFSSQRNSQVNPYSAHSRASYSLHEMYELCEYLNCEPWYCLPGTLLPTEMENFMEYLGGPKTQGYGKLRAELGHPQPWTETLSTIHVEFGNEAWNNSGPYQVGGFNGEDYWQDLIATAKRSPHYKPNVVFHVAGQAANVYLNRNLLDRFPAADRFAVAPYILQSISMAEAADLSSDEALFRWAFAWPIRRAKHPSGAMRQNFGIAAAANKELSVYEINHHITHGDASLEPRNRISTSIGGGLNVLSTMLSQMKDFGIRSQCMFNLIQHSYNASGVGDVRLWGTALNFRGDRQRLRPTFLAAALANHVIRGDLIETTHRGTSPTFSATGVFERRGEKETLSDLPCLHSYAFRDQSVYGLIVLNLDVYDSHSIQLALSGRPNSGNAKGWLLSAPSISSNNELENTNAEVTVKQANIAGFGPNWKYELPPHSALGLVWSQ